MFSVLVMLVPRAAAQGPEKAIPEVIDHKEPYYPPLCRQAHIAGEVPLRFTTDGHSVISVESVSGHPLLRFAAEENVKTWKFVPHEPGTFHVTFRYEILSSEHYVTFLPSPSIVEIAEAPPVVNVYWGWADRGLWKANLISPRGGSQQVLVQIMNSGPDGNWISGSVTGARGEKLEIGDGHFDEKRNMFWFTVMLTQLHQKPVSTFFIGKISGRKITGTFVDDSGATGEWSAAKEK